MRFTGIAAAAACACLAFSLVACGTAATGASVSPVASGSAAGSPASSAAGARAETPDEGDIIVNEVVSNSDDGGHAIEVDGGAETYANVKVEKTGDSDQGDEADFYGDNAAVFATNGGTLNLSESIVESDGTHANGVFSYGEGTTVDVSDSVIETAGDCSGGIMTTGGATMNARNLRITTSGNSSAAIRSDRGGGTVTVDGGVYATSGTGSPVIYSTADITVNDAELASTASQGVVVEGKNSVTLNDVELVADNNKKNSDKSDFYQAVMIYQSMSGDAASGKSSFAMEGGSLVNANGDVFFVNNTACDINLDGVSIANNGDGVFLRAAAAGWGNEGSNGGQVSLNASNQVIDGDLVVDDVSSLNLYLGDSSFTGAINAAGQAGEVYVGFSGASRWTLTADSYITSLTCDADSIDLNGHALYVNGQAYAEGTAQTGEAIEVAATEPAGGPGTPPDGEPGADGGGSSHGGRGGNGDAPSGKPGGNGGDSTPPEKPDGGSGTPPAKPDGDNGDGGRGEGAPSAKSSGKGHGGAPSSRHHGEGAAESQTGGPLAFV